MISSSVFYLFLATILPNDIVIDDEMDTDLKNSFEFVINYTIFHNDIESGDKIAEALLQHFNQKPKECKERAPTAKLCIQYFHIVSIAKGLIRAKLMGDLQAHLNSV